MKCLVCGEETGLEVGGVGFCVFCESQRPYYGAVVDSRVVYEEWRRRFVVSTGWVGFGLLVVAAVYELVNW